MTSAPASIFVATKNTPLDAGKSNERPADSALKGESFHQMMSRSLKPHQNELPVENPRRQRTSSVFVEKEKPAEACVPLAQADDDTATITATAGAAEKNATEAKKQPLDAPETNHMAQDDSAGLGVLNNAQILPPAPAPEKCFFKSVAPAVFASGPTNPAAGVQLIAQPEGNSPSSAVTAITAEVDINSDQALTENVLQLKSVSPQQPTSPKTSGLEKPGAKIAGEPASMAKNPALPEANNSGLEKGEDGLAKVLPVADAASSESSPADSGAFDSAKPHGTPVAKHDLPMKNTEQTNKVAEPGEKELPGNAGLSARENDLPGRSIVTPAIPRVERADPPVSTISASQDFAVRSNQPMNETVSIANVSSLRTETMDRTHDLMALHGLRLGDSKLDSLQVVIRPDAGTQLSLELRQRDGGIQAQAILQQGDAAHLKQHWPELQQRLEERGIKLAPLGNNDLASAGSGNQEFKKQQPQPAEHEPFAAGTFTGFGLTGAIADSTNKPEALAATSGGWQTWA